MDSLIYEIVKDNIINIKELNYNDIPKKSLDRIIKVEVIIQELYKSNDMLIESIKNNKLSITFFAEDKKLGITRRSIYADEYLLRYINKRIEEQKDYFNLERLKYIIEKNELLQEEYNKVMDNIIDTFDMKINIEAYKDNINQLLEQDNKLRDIIKIQQKTINNLNNELKSYKIIKLK